MQEIALILKQFILSGRTVDEELCPLCGRPLGTENVDWHHLVPKSYKGKEQFAIHRICHRKIHSVLSEKELRDHFHTLEALKAHADIRTFIAWVARKPPAYYTRTATSNRKKK